MQKRALLHAHFICIEHPCWSVLLRVSGPNVHNISYYPSLFLISSSLCKSWGTWVKAICAILWVNIQLERRSWARISRIQHRELLLLWVLQSPERHILHLRWCRDVLFCVKLIYHSLYFVQKAMFILIINMQILRVWAFAEFLFSTKDRLTWLGIQLKSKG